MEYIQLCPLQQSSHGPNRAHLDHQHGIKHLTAQLDKLELVSTRTFNILGTPK